MNRHGLEVMVLDMLVDGPSSLAALYGALCRHYHLPRDLDIYKLVNTLEIMEQKGYIICRMVTGDGHQFRPSKDEIERAVETYQQWLPHAEPDEFILDEVGLWCQVTEYGQKRLKYEVPHQDLTREGKWTLEDDAMMKKLIVHATSVEVAEKAISTYLAIHLGIRLLEGSRVFENGITFKLADGTKVEDGIRLTNHYS